MKTMYFKFVFCVLLIAIAGCAANKPKLTQAEIDQANTICTNQVNMDRLNNEPKWFTRWLKCKQAKVMPFEIRIYPHKEKEIRQMYTKLLSMGVAVDEGRSRVTPVYDEWDRMQVEIGMFKGNCVKNRDGSQKCIKPNGSILFIHTKDGDIVPVK